MIYKIWKVFVLICLIIIPGYMIIRIFSPKNADDLISPLPIAVNSVIKSVNEIKENKSSGLGQAVKAELEGTKGIYGIYIKNLKTGDSFSRDEHRQFAAASLYKLWIMATAYDQIEKGNLKENEVMSRSVESLNNTFNIASDEAELKEGTVIFPVKEAIEKMITISHNYAALLLSVRLRLVTVSQYLKDHGFTESSLGVPPLVTPYEAGLFFEKLYLGKLGNPESNQEMISILKKQTFNHKLPKLLPEGTVIAHKTGELGKVTHDTGIVYSPRGDYVIAVLTESSDPAGAESRIAKISKAVYDYFENQ